MQIDMPRRRLSLSLTPLIDVVFILLVFFMLASNFMQWRSLELAVPGEGGEAMPDQKAPLVLRLERGGALRIDGEAVAVAKLPQRLAALRAAGSDGPVLLQPQSEVPLQRIVTVLDRLATSGVRDVTLVEDRE